MAQAYMSRCKRCLCCLMPSYHNPGQMHRCRKDAWKMSGLVRRDGPLGVSSESACEPCLARAWRLGRLVMHHLVVRPRLTHTAPSDVSVRGRKGLKRGMYPRMTRRPQTRGTKSASESSALFIARCVKDLFVSSVSVRLC